jgi:hypothetical protein
LVQYTIYSIYYNCSFLQDILIFLKSQNTIAMYSSMILLLFRYYKINFVFIMLQGNSCSDHKRILMTYNMTPIINTIVSCCKLVACILYYQKVTGGVIRVGNVLYHSNCLRSSLYVVLFLEISICCRACEAR